MRNIVQIAQALQNQDSEAKDYMEVLEETLDRLPLNYRKVMMEFSQKNPQLLLEMETPQKAAYELLSQMIIYNETKHSSHKNLRGNLGIFIKVSWYLVEWSGLDASMKKRLQTKLLKVIAGYGITVFLLGLGLAFLLGKSLSWFALGLFSGWGFWMFVLMCLVFYLVIQVVLTVLNQNMFALVLREIKAVSPFRETSPEDTRLPELVLKQSFLKALLEDE